MSSHPRGMGSSSREIYVTSNFDGRDLPPAERATSPLSIKGHGGWVRRIAVFPDGARFATGCLDGHVRVFVRHGDGDAAIDIAAHPGGVGGLAVLGADALVSSDWSSASKPSVSSWSVSTGKMLDRLDVSLDGSGDGVSAITVLGPGLFAVATELGVLSKNRELVFVSHFDGRALRVVRRIKRPHRLPITDIAAHGNAVFTASKDETACVWSAVTGERLATLRGHTRALTSVDASADWAVTASEDCTVRVYRNGGDFSLFAVFRGMHCSEANCISILTNSVVLTGSRDGTLCFTPLARNTAPVARVQCDGEVFCAQLLNDARMAVGTFDPDGHAPLSTHCAVVTAPAAAEEVVRMQTRALYSATAQDLRPASDPGPPLEGAMIRVNGGLLTAGAACREFITKTNCSRCIEEWWYGHLLLMVAVDSGEIAGRTSFKSEADFWLQELYLPVKDLIDGVQDSLTVRECLERARAAKVIEITTSFLTVTDVRRDLPHEVHKLRDAGEKMMNLLAQLLIYQAAMDVDLQRIGRGVGRKKKIRHVLTILSAVCSPIPHAGAILCGGAAPVDNESPQALGQIQVENLLGAGVGLQMAVTPTLCERFVGRSEHFLKNKKSVSTASRADVERAVEELGMRWEDFESVITQACARMRLQRSQ